VVYRKGTLGSGLLYFVYFLMIALIVGGIYGGLIAYFGKGYDYREREANLLLQETKDCFADEGFFDLNTDLKEDLFFDKCGFNRNVLEDGNHMIYIKNKNNIEFSVGVADFRVKCFLNARTKNRDYPICVPYELDGNYILVGSSQNSKRVAA